MHFELDWLISLLPDGSIIFQYLAIYNNANLHNSNQVETRLKILPHKVKLSKIAQRLLKVCQNGHTARPPESMNAKQWPLNLFDDLIVCCRIYCFTTNFDKDRIIGQ